jgi:CheY-specific phosphatase CheX
MIGGGFKSALCDAGWVCAMSTPAIIRGAYAIEVPQDLRAQVSHLSCQNHPFAVEVHIKFG